MTLGIKLVQGVTITIAFCYYVTIKTQV